MSEEYKNMLKGLLRSLFQFDSDIDFEYKSVSRGGLM